MRTIIHTRKLNETHMMVTSEKSVEMEMWEFFSFQVPGYKFMRSYKLGVWDGFLRNFNLNTKRLYIGLRDELQRFADENGYQVVDTIPLIVPEFAREEIEAWLDTDPNTVHGKTVEMRDYQRESIIQAITRKRMLLVSPTSSGKSFFLYKVCKFLLLHGKKILLQVPSTMLVEQMYKDFEDYATGSGFDVSGSIQRIYSGYSSEITHDLAISTWQTQHSKSKKMDDMGWYFNQFDVIIQDEVHLAKSLSIQGILESSTEATYKIGCTGTLSGAKCDASVLTGLFGPVFKAITTKQLMDRGQIAQLKIKMLQLKYPIEDCKAITGAKDYHLEIDWLVQHERRNRFIANLALSRTGNTLILLTFVEKHGKILNDLIKELSTDPDRPIYFIWSDVGVEEREQIRSALETHTNAIVVATYSLMSTGVSIRNLHNIIFGSPSKSMIRVLQSVGRGLRLGDNKSYCELFDIADNLVYKSKKNFAWLHGHERVTIYASEQFDFKMIDVPL